MTIRPGYKQTEIGALPEDWTLPHYVSCGEVIDGDRGESYPGDADLKTSGHCLFLNAGNVTKTGFQFKECQFISQVKDNQLRKGKLVRFDVVLTTRGTLGNFAYYDVTVPYENVRVNSGMVIMRAISRNVSAHYHYWILRSSIIKSQIERLAFGSAQSQLTVRGISTLKIPIPPTIAEQQTIAEALSDADALIESLEQLIAKKRQIKQGVMQQLLTGRKRLPGFAGQFQETTLGKQAYIKTGGKNNEDKNDNGAYPFFVRSAYIERIDSYSHDCEAILVPGEGNIGDIFHYMNGRFDVHQRVYAITGFQPNTSAKFLYYYLSKYFGTWAMQNTVKATVDSLRLPTFLNFELRLPSTNKEQTAIAEILSDMDAEITKLETRLAKARQVKQGMMQQLLTGRVRLV